MRNKDFYYIIEKPTTPEPKDDEGCRVIYEDDKVIAFEIDEDKIKPAKEEGDE